MSKHDIDVSKAKELFSRNDGDPSTDDWISRWLYLLPNKSYVIREDGGFNSPTNGAMTTKIVSAAAAKAWLSEFASKAVVSRAFPEIPKKKLSKATLPIKRVTRSKPLRSKSRTRR